MLKAVIFDFDGTLADTLPLCLKAFQKAIEPYAHRPFSLKEIINALGPSEEGTIKAFIPDHYQEGVRDYLRYYEEYHDMCPAPFTGIRELLEFLRKHSIIIAMVTGKGEHSCATSLDYYKFGEYFDMVETGSPDGQCKTEKINKVLTCFHLRPDEAVYIGDAFTDITAAREAMIPIISVAWASTANRDELSKGQPDELFSSVGELRRYLEQALSAGS